MQNILFEITTKSLLTYSRQVPIYKLKVLILKYQTYKKLTYKILNALKKIVAKFQANTLTIDLKLCRKTSQKKIQKKKSKDTHV